MFEEDNFFGKHSGAEPSAKRWERPMARVGDKKYEGWSMVGSGYAAVWATANTRAVIWKTGRPLRLFVRMKLLLLFVREANLPQIKNLKLRVFVNQRRLFHKGSSGDPGICQRNRVSSLDFSRFFQ